MVSKDNIRLNITLPRDLISSLDAAAAYWGQSRSDYIIDLIRYDVERGATAHAREHAIQEQAARVYGKLIFAEASVPDKGGKQNGAD